MSAGTLGTTAITDRRTQRSSQTNMCDPDHNAKVKLPLRAVDGCLLADADADVLIRAVPCDSQAS